MKKKLFLFLPLFLFSVASLRAEEPQFKSSSSLQVDGIYNSTSVVITGRLPILSWEYASGISSFTLRVSVSSGMTSLLWDYAGSTTSANSINFITRVPFNSDGTANAELQPYTTYWWQATLYNDGASSMSAVNQFFTVPAAVTLDKEKYDLAIDWNNPFNPAKGQITKFRFVAKDRDRQLQVRIYTVSGDLVMEWPEQFALKGAWYSIDWNGTNNMGEVVGRGIYLVNLEDVTEHKGVTRKVMVVK